MISGGIRLILEAEFGDVPLNFEHTLIDQSMVPPIYARSRNLLDCHQSLNFYYVLSDR